MVKEVAFLVTKGLDEKVRSLVPEQSLSRKIRNFILNYEISEGLYFAERKDVEKEQMQLYFNDDTNYKLNHLVDQLKHKGINANRSVCMEIILNDFIRKMNTESYNGGTRSLKAFDVFCESGIRDILQKLIGYRDRNDVIEDFIMNEYKFNGDLDQLTKKPEKREAIKFRLDEEAYEKIQDLVSTYKGVKGVNMNAFMRNVINQYIDSKGQSSTNQLLVERHLDSAVREYESVYGKELLKSKLLAYVKEGVEDE